MKERYSNKEIYKGVFLRDKEIISYIQNTYWKRIEGIVTRLGGTEQDVEDLFQDTIEAIIFSIDNRADLKQEGFRKLLEGTAWNIYFKNNRRIKLSDMLQIENIPEPVVEDNTYEDEEAFSFFMEIMREQLKKLKEICRKIIEMVFAELTSQEIAEQMKLSVARVYKQKSLCRDQLVDLVRQHPEFRRIQYIDSNPIK